MRRGGCAGQAQALEVFFPHAHGRGLARAGRIHFGSVWKNQHESEYVC